LLSFYHCSILYIFRQFIKCFLYILTKYVGFFLTLKVFISHKIKKGAVKKLNCSPSSRQLKKYKFFLPAEIYLLAVFMQQEP